MHSKIIALFFYFTPAIATPIRNILISIFISYFSTIWNKISNYLHLIQFYSNIMINIRTNMKNDLDGKVALKDKILH